MVSVRANICLFLRVKVPSGELSVHVGSSRDRRLSNQGVVSSFRFGFGVIEVEGGRVGKIIEGWSPVKVCRNATILFVSLSVSIIPS